MAAHRRFVALTALTTLSVFTTVSSAHASDNAHAGDSTSTPRLDPSVQRPWFMAMRGATATHAWVVMQSDGSKSNDEGVVDLKTGCVVETMPPFKHLLNATRPNPFAKGATADESKKVEALLSTDASVKADIARYVAAGRRFGQRRLAFGSIGSDGVAFSSDGQTIAIEGSEAVFRSRDGGSTYDRLDTNMNRTPAVTTDGKWILFERCSDASRRNQVCPAASREVRIVAADNSTAARTVAIGSGLLRGLDPTGQKLVVVRYDLGAEVTVMHIDPSTASGAPTRVFAIASTVVKKDRFHDIEPSPKTGAFGLFDDNDVFPTNVMTGARAPEPAATLSSVACKMVKVVPVGPGRLGP